jgi:hypothetical protein
LVARARRFDRERVRAPRKIGDARAVEAHRDPRVGVHRERHVTAEPGECVYRRTSALPNGVLLMQVGGRIVRADITAPGIATDEGVEFGATEARVHEVYGSRVAISLHKYTDGRYLTIATDSGDRAIFETDGERVTRHRVGRVPEVEWVEGCS